MWSDRLDYWLQRHEAQGNWLALGLLLAAWNLERPPALKHHDSISVRAVQATQTTRSVQTRVIKAST